MGLGRFGRLVAVEIYGNRNGKACLSMPYLTLKRFSYLGRLKKVDPMIPRSTISMSRYFVSSAMRSLIVTCTVHTQSSTGNLFTFFRVHFSSKV